MGEVFNDSETDIKRCIVMIFHCFDALELCGIREFSKNVTCEYSDYTNAFLWIVIYSIDDNKKKRKLFEFETD